MKLFSKCPICGGALQEKKVEKLLRGGHHAAFLNVPAEVCLHCGERLYSPEIISKFEKTRAQLAAGKFSGLRVMGKALTAAS